MGILRIRRERRVRLTNGKMWKNEMKDLLAFDAVVDEDEDRDQKKKEGDPGYLCSLLSDDRIIRGSCMPLFGGWPQCAPSCIGDSPLLNERERLTCNNKQPSHSHFFFYDSER
jgi:hypothetical protein